MAVNSQPRQQAARSEAEQRVRRYMLDNEEISYSLRFRPTGFVAWLKSLLGYGVTHWFVTNQRVIQETRISGGFVFQDIPHGKLSSIEYGTKLPLGTIALGIFVSLFGLGAASSDASGIGVLLFAIGLGLIGYAFIRRPQILQVHASGGVSFGLNIRKGQQVDEMLWYLHAERAKRA